MLIYITLVFLAAVMNAIMDRTENIVAFNRSIFSHADKRFWCKEISWQYATKIFGWKADAWHIAKTCMLISLAVACFFFKSFGKWYIDLVFLAAFWNFTFVLFYKKILYR